MGGSDRRRRGAKYSRIEAVAGNGLLDRRALLGRGVIYAGAMSTGALGSFAAAAEPLKDAPLTDAPWSREPGAAIEPYERPSRFEKTVVRTLSNPNGQPGAQGARTPHHLVNGVITPNGLHFVVSYGGAPDIDPDKHRLAIHGMVKQPLVFTVDALARYPMVTRVTFLECGGNSAPLFSPQPLQANVQALHGLASCAEWTGVKLSTLLEETGIDPKARWFIAEGADAPHLSRSVPLKKGLDDAMIALYQNGERLMPANGYPMRLLLPGYEGNMNVKYLRRIKLVEEPAMSYWESKVYAQILPNGKAYQFYLLQEVKSFITQPSPGLTLKGPGLYELFRRGPDLQGHGFGRWRAFLGGGGVAGADTEQGLHPFPHAVALGRQRSGFAKPRNGRGRQRAAHPRRICRPARRIEDGPAGRGVSEPALQCSHQLGDRHHRRGEACLRVAG